MVAVFFPKPQRPVATPRCTVLTRLVSLSSLAHSGYSTAVRATIAVFGKGSTPTVTRGERSFSYHTRPNASQNQTSFFLHIQTPFSLPGVVRITILQREPLAFTVCGLDRRLQNPRKYKVQVTFYTARAVGSFYWVWRHLSPAASSHVCNLQRSFVRSVCGNPYPQQWRASRASASWATTARRS